MNKKTDPPGETDEIRCPRLGHHIGFAYCRSENRGLPCFKTLDCWHERFAVEAFLRVELSDEEWEQVFCSPTKSKMISLVELIEEAKKRKKEAP